MINHVVLTKQAEKDLIKLPAYVGTKLMKWVEDVEETCLEEVRKIPGYHDEPCKGKRQGQHSIRLSIAYRAFYRIINNTVEYVSIEEVNKHDY